MIAVNKYMTDIQDS